MGTWQRPLDATTNIAKTPTEKQHVNPHVHPTGQHQHHHHHYHHHHHQQMNHFE
jgi:hypothetical protein